MAKFTAEDYARWAAMMARLSRSRPAENHDSDEDSLPDIEQVYDTFLIISPFSYNLSFFSHAGQNQTLR